MALNGTILNINILTSKLFSLSFVCPNQRRLSSLNSLLSVTMSSETASSLTWSWDVLKTFFKHSQLRQAAISTKNQKDMVSKILWGQFRLTLQGRYILVLHLTVKFVKIQKYIVKHMKSCCDISKKRNGHIHSNVFEVWKITFAKKSNPNFMSVMIQFLISIDNDKLNDDFTNHGDSF